MSESKSLDILSDSSAKHILRHVLKIANFESSIGGHIKFKLGKTVIDQGRIGTFKFQIRKLPYIYGKQGKSDNHCLVSSAEHCRVRLETKASNHLLQQFSNVY